MKTSKILSTSFIHRQFHLVAHLVHYISMPLKGLSLVVIFTSTAPISLSSMEILALNRSYATENAQKPISSTDCSGLVTSELSEKAQSLLNLIRLKLKSANSEDEVKDIIEPVFKNTEPANPFRDDSSTADAQLANASELLLPDITDRDWENLKSALRLDVKYTLSEIDSIVKTNSRTATNTNFGASEIIKFDDLEVRTPMSFITTPKGEVYFIVSGVKPSQKTGWSDGGQSNLLYHYSPARSSFQLIAEVSDPNNEFSFPSKTDFYINIAPGSKAPNEQYALVVAQDIGKTSIVKIDLITGEIQNLQTYGSTDFGSAIEFLFSEDNMAYFYISHFKGKNKTLIDFVQINLESNIVNTLWSGYDEKYTLQNVSEDQLGNIHWTLLQDNNTVIRASYSPSTQNFEFTPLEKRHFKNPGFNQLPLYSLDDAQWIFARSEHLSSELSFYHFDRNSSEIKKISTIDSNNPSLISEIAYFKPSNSKGLLVGVNYTDEKNRINLLHSDDRNLDFKVIVTIDFDSNVEQFEFIEDNTGRLYLLNFKEGGLCSLLEILPEEGTAVTIATTHLSKSNRLIFKDIRLIETLDGNRQIVFGNSNNQIEVLPIQMGK